MQRQKNRMRLQNPERRRGFSVLIVLLLIAVTLSLSYASIRTQSVNRRIQRNATFGVSARSAAASGLATALATMHTTAWRGVDTTLTGRLSRYENFTVEFVTGDDDLEPSDADYDRYPYRVTLKATGYAADPIHPTVIATHHARAVVELIPRALSSSDTELNELTAHTVCQWRSGACSLAVPFRIEGPARFRGQVRLDQELKWTTDQQWWYYLGLNDMRKAGQADWRPFTGPVYFRFDEQDAQAYALMNTALQAGTIDTSSASTFTWRSNDGLVSYRLFPGGKTYDVETVSANLAGVVLTSNAATNPAGLFVRANSVQIGNAVTIRGSLFTRGDGSSNIVVQGNDVRLEPMDLPALDDASDPVQLPVLISAGDISVGNGTQAVLKGLVLARDDFNVATAHQNQTSLHLEGHLACRNLIVGHRTPWNRSAAWWNLVWNLFWIQRSEGIQWFPALLSLMDLNINPRITIVPDTRSIRYHYYHPTQPIYVPHADDDGLRWNVVRWTTNP